jgi:hypothetical protein
LTTWNVNEPANPKAVTEQTAVAEVPGMAAPVIDEAAQAGEQAACASQNLQAVTQASTVLARGFQEASNEMFRSAQNRFTKNMDGLNRMAGCRSVRAVVAAQSELMRDNLQLTIDTNRRIAELSVRIADEATGAIRVTEKG